jgi:hypothetical protein
VILGLMSKDMCIACLNGKVEHIKKHSWGNLNQEMIGQKQWKTLGVLPIWKPWHLKI